jgi:ABC-type branched-chain amino acid transport systems, ATPase component
MSDEIQISLSQVSVGYGHAPQRVQVLDAVSFELKTNERVALIGRVWIWKKHLDESIGRAFITRAR